MTDGEKSQGNLASVDGGSPRAAPTHAAVRHYSLAAIRHSAA
jgi:hypothetical protein